MTHPTAAQLIEQGLFHHRQGDLGTAMERYTEVLRINPENPDALYYVAVAACQAQQFMQGIELARRSLQFKPRQARAYNLIGQALHRQGDIKAALESFDEALTCDIDFADAYSNRGNMLSEFGRHAEALSSFDRALALKPNASDWLNRGATLAAMGRVEDAIASYDKAIALDPEFAVPHVNRASTLAEAGRFDEALADVERALTLAPNVSQAHLLRAGLLDKLGRAEEAQASREKAADLEERQKVNAEHADRRA
jgi:tetratricopeptide (TPR) repeat protein